MNYTFRTIQSEVSTFNFLYDATDDEHIGMGVCVVRRIRTQSSASLSSFLSPFYSTVFDCLTLRFARQMFDTDHTITLQLLLTAYNFYSHHISRKQAFFNVRKFNPVIYT